MKSIILLVAAAFAACNFVHLNGSSMATKPGTTVPVASQTNDAPRRITTAELDELMKQGKVFVLDVRNKDMYDRGHIRGAKLIPVQEVAQRTKELPRDKTIVTYCS